MKYDLIVIGAGPGGYVAAIRSAQLGGKVLLVEKDKLGGVCLNRGCIPTKTLLKSADKWRELQCCADFGLKAANIGFDFSVITARKNAVVTQLRSGIEQLIKSNDIELLYGQASIQADGSIKICGDNSDIRVEGKSIILATGSSPSELSIPGGDLPGVINSDQLLELGQLPRSMIIIGAGAVGIEFASIFRAFGCDTTVVEVEPTVLPKLDSDIIKRAGLSLRKQGLKIMTDTKVAHIRSKGEGVVVTVDTSKGLEELAVEKVLLATGRRPNTNGLGLEAAGVTYNHTGIPVNARFETNISGIYAIGDVTGRFMWAHAATAAGIAAAENAMGGNSTVDYRAIPRAVFTNPEIAMVGLTEQEAGFEIRVSRFAFAANGKAVVSGETDGLVKIIAGAGDGKIIGMHIMGPHASELIMEGALAIRNGLTADDIAHTIHAHPTLSEAIMEAAQGSGGMMIHQVKLKSDWRSY